MLRLASALSAMPGPRTACWSEPTPSTLRASWIEAIEAACNRVLLDCRREPVQQNKAAVAVAQAKRPSRRSGAPFVWHLGARGLPRRRPRLSGGRCLRHAQTVLLAGSTAAELEHIIEVEPWLCGRRVPVAALLLPQALSIGYFVRNNHTTNLRSPGARIHRRVRPARAALYCVLIKW